MTTMQNIAIQQTLLWNHHSQAVNHSIDLAISAPINEYGSMITIQQLAVISQKP